MRCGGRSSFTSPMLMTNALEVDQGDEGGDIQPNQNADNTATIPK